jgi:hypothetical protein
VDAHGRNPPLVRPPRSASCGRTAGSRAYYSRRRADEVVEMRETNPRED